MSDEPTKSARWSRVVLYPALVLGAALLLRGSPPVRGGLFWLAYARIERGMTFEEVDELLEGYDRDDTLYNWLLGVPNPPDGGLWFCPLGGTHDFNHVIVRFDDGRVTEKSLSWDW
ncbi:MAG: hypothetical protein ACF8XB_08410 [Planctomycetota bacterium JB042]